MKISMIPWAYNFKWINELLSSKNSFRFTFLICWWFYQSIEWLLTYILREKLKSTCFSGNEKITLKIKINKSTFGEYNALFKKIYWKNLSEIIWKDNYKKIEKVFNEDRNKLLHWEYSEKSYQNLNIENIKKYGLLEDNLFYECWNSNFIENITNDDNKYLLYVLNLIFIIVECFNISKDCEDNIKLNWSLMWFLLEIEKTKILLEKNLKN